MKLNKADSLALVKLCCLALDEKKAEDLRVMDVSEQSSITDFLVLATGNSAPHLRALRIEVEKALETFASIVKTSANLIGCLKATLFTEAVTTTRLQ